MTAGREPWYRATLTDRDGEWDNGSIIVALTVAGMLGLQAYDVIALGHDFNPAELGMGIGAVLTGFAAYLWGDTRRPPDFQQDYPSKRRTRVDIVDDR